MPSFIKTKADETRWKECKAGVSKTTGRSPTAFTSRDWARVNGCFHRRKGRSGVGRRRMSETAAVKGDQQYG